MNNDIKKAANILKQGGIVVFPTDTAFGIGCRIDDKKAIERLVKIRGRKKDQPLPVLISNLDMAKKYLKQIPKKVIEELIKKYWPGALTIVLNCKKDLVNPIIRGNKDTLGLRVPNHKTTLALIEEVGIPIIGCSANFSDEKTPIEFKDIDKKLIKSVDFVLTGECYLKKASTVIDCSKRKWNILRQGALNLKKINLLIDTSSNEYISVGLETEGKKYIEKQKINFQKAQAVLPMVEKILNKHSLTLKDLTSITVNPGPGSYTGLRVGISVANSLGHFLKIPINNQPVGKEIQPLYK